MKYTPKFIEEYPAAILKADPGLTNEQIAEKFLKEHGKNFDDYLRSIGAVVQSNHGSEINQLEGMKEELKEQLILVLQKKDILPDDEKGKLVKDYIKNTQINFTLLGGGSGGGVNLKENYVNIDWIQTYRFITDFKEKGFSFYFMAMSTVFHELAHRLSIFLGQPSNQIEIEGRYYNYEESFAQGVAHLAMTSLGFEDPYTEYYVLKKDEIMALGELRERVTAIIAWIMSGARKLKLDVLWQRCYNLQYIYNYRDQEHRIESYAKPLEEQMIKFYVKKGLDKFKV